MTYEPSEASIEAGANGILRDYPAAANWSLAKARVLARAVLIAAHEPEEARDRVVSNERDAAAKKFADAMLCRIDEMTPFPQPPQQPKNGDSK
jgi:hypothetical protein